MNVKRVRKEFTGNSRDRPGYVVRPKGGREGRAEREAKGKAETGGGD